MTANAQRSSELPPVLSGNAVQASVQGVAYLDMQEGTAVILGSAWQPGAKTLSNSTIGGRVALLFGVLKRDAAALVGVSERTLSRHTRPSTGVLDRSYALSRTFAKVHAGLGLKGARQWFGAPNAALGGRLPRGLIRTRAGERQVERVIQDLQDGNFL